MRNPLKQSLLIFSFAFATSNLAFSEALGACQSYAEKLGKLLNEEEEKAPSVLKEEEKAPSVRVKYITAFHPIVALDAVPEIYQVFFAENTAPSYEINIYDLSEKDTCQIQSLKRL